jgi:Fe-S-cluster containining protein
VYNITENKKENYMQKESNKSNKKNIKHKVKTLRQRVQEIYKLVDLSTTCPGHCVCCTVACPQMNYSEFLVIAESLYNEGKKEQRIEILKKSVEYFFSTSLVKPCPLLNEKRCSVYENRPLSCRMFGLWPNEMYEERVAKFMATTGMKREEVPLNTQCKYVKRVDESVPLDKDTINSLYNLLNDLDQSTQDYSKEQIEKRYNQRTWHDWFMVSVFGESRLADLSNFFVAAESQEIVDDFVKQMIIQIDVVGEDIFKKI